MRGKQLSWVLSFLTLAALGSGNLAAQLTPLGPETRVDTLSDEQFPGCPALAVRPMGAFLVAWNQGTTTQGLPTDSYVRLYAAGGAPLTPQQVLLGNQGLQVDTVSVLSYGYRVLFQDLTHYPNPPVPLFYRQRVEPDDGHTSGAPRRVGAANTLWVWPGTGESLLAGRHDLGKQRAIAEKVNSDGKPAGFSYVLNSRPVQLRFFILNRDPVIAPLGDRRFVAVWSSNSLLAASDAARPVIRARRFSLSGPLGKDFTVNEEPEGPAPPSVTPPILAADRFGRFAVAWVLSDSSSSSIRLRTFDDEGEPTGSEVPAATATVEEGFLRPVSAAFDDSGHLLLLFAQESSGPTHENDLRARLFDSDGSPLGPAFELHSAASGSFDSSFCGHAGWAKGSWVVTWVANQRRENGPGAIFVRRFSGP